MTEILVECIGEKMATPERHIVLPDGRRFHCCIEHEAKVGKSFTVGIFFSKGLFTDDPERYPRDQRVCVLTETPIDPSYVRLKEFQDLFPIIMTHQRSLYEQGPPFYPLLLGTNWVIGDAIDQMWSPTNSGKKKELVSFVGSIEHEMKGAYSFRNEVYHLVSERFAIPCFGKGIQPFASKRDVIEPYMFSIAMENHASDYYFTEKLIDCFLMGSIPIYFGCMGIGDVFDPRGILQFTDIEECRRTLTSLTSDLYDQMLPHLIRNQRIVEQSQLFGYNNLLERILAQIPRQMSSAPPIRYSVSRVAQTSTWFERLLRRLLPRQ